MVGVWIRISFGCTIVLQHMESRYLQITGVVAEAVSASFPLEQSFILTNTKETAIPSSTRANLPPRLEVALGRHDVRMSEPRDRQPRHCWSWRGS